MKIGLQGGLGLFAANCCRLVCAVSRQASFTKEPQCRVSRKKAAVLSGEAISQGGVDLLPTSLILVSQGGIHERIASIGSFGLRDMNIR